MQVTHLIIIRERPKNPLRTVHDLHGPAGEEYQTRRQQVAAFVAGAVSCRVIAAPKYPKALMSRPSFSHAQILSGALRPSNYSMGWIGAGDEIRTRDQELGKQADDSGTEPDRGVRGLWARPEASRSVRNGPSAVNVDTRWTPASEPVLRFAGAIA
jgi:hypothetical protein